MTTEQKTELIQLLTHESNEADAGILFWAKKGVLGDKQLAKIARIEELLELL